MQFIFEQRVVSFKQLARKFFSTSLPQAAFARFEKLVLAKYLKKDVIIWKNKRTVIYSSTLKGINAFSKYYKYEITNFNCQSDSIRHDLGLINIRERFEQARMVTDYYTENMLQKCSALVEDEVIGQFSSVNSDAAISIKATEKKFNLAVEYEISIKEEFRYVEKIRQYYYSPKIALVLYICGNYKIEKIIRRVDSELGQTYPKVCTCLEDNFLRPEMNLSFSNYKDEIIEIS